MPLPRTTTTTPRQPAGPTRLPAGHQHRRHGESGRITGVRATGRPATGRLVAACVLTAGALVLTAGCGGKPPEPLPTAPPQPTGSLPSGYASGVPIGPLPSGNVPTLPGLPSGALPNNPLPTYPVPANPLPTRTLPTRTTPATTRPTTLAPSPAPKCRSGPTAAQVLAVVTGGAGVPAGEDLTVTKGPFCAGTWQFSTVVLTAEPDSEPLQVVTTGRPTALTLVEAGADVCSERVQNQAPRGIRVLACGF